MKTFFLKIPILIVLMFSCNYFLRIFIENKWNISCFPDQKGKLKEVEYGNFNTIVLGSSRTYSSINVNPLNALQFENNKIDAYNFGLSSLSFPNTYFIAKKILENPTKCPKILLVEVGYNEQYLKANYYSLYNEPYYALFKKLDFIDIYSFVRMRIKTAFQWLQVSFPIVQTNTNRGFLPYGTSNFVAPMSITHKQYFEFEQIKNYDPRITVDSKIENASQRIFQTYLLDLANLAGQKQVKIYFFLPYRINPESNKTTIPVFNALPNSMKFNPNINKKFSQLMLPKYSWDMSHLDANGAEIYSEIFALEFKKQIIEGGY